MCDWHGTIQHYKILVMFTIETYLFCYVFTKVLSVGTVSFNCWNFRDLWLYMYVSTHCFCAAVCIRSIFAKSVVASKLDAFLECNTLYTLFVGC